ncbi:hypothetical protein Q3O59_02490 [Alkalimonas delamerensis]|uniref:Uncharacterized protein n=1 Tax=Alkalimonas delamerensis TaxID=265981 RepID=A0ABT9GLQ0_9GAMM|nr:hypothetical protein [Alkalimonas delamerensis]MDP4527902.1 hypothetical protein [Alkalimonas delamerensis]
MMKALKFCTATVLLLLTACGGGDSSPPVAGGGQTGSNMDKPPFLIEADYLEAYGAIAVNLPEGMLQIAHYSDTILIQQSLSFETFLLCSNGGGRTVSINQPLPITQGTIITDELEDCYVDTLDSILNGKIELTITDHQINNNSEILMLDVDLSSVRFRGSPELTVQDTVTVALTSEPLLRTMKVTPKQAQVRFRFTDGDVFSLSQFQLTSELDLSTALYRAEFQGRIALNHFSSDLAIATKEALQGYLGEYPHQGQVELTDSRNNKLMISANQVVNSELANVQLNQGAPYLFYWTSLTDGTYWSWPGLNEPGYAQRFRHDNFEFLGMVGTTNFEDFPTQGTLSYLFSRPVASVQGYWLEHFFDTWDWEHESVAAEITIEGALVHIRPKTALSPGVRYSTNTFEATNTLGISRYIYTSQPLTATNVIRAVIQKDSPLVTTTTQPTLSAENSQIAAGLSASYQWQELTMHGIVFDDPTAASTSFSLTKIPDDSRIQVRVTVTDELGRSHSAETLLYFLNGQVNAAFYESDSAEDWIGQGKSSLLTTEEVYINGYSWNKSSLRVGIEGYNDNDYIWWSLDLATAEGQELKPGLYQDATRAAFKPSHGNGLEFSGNGRGCNSLNGWFEIHEIELTHAGYDYDPDYMVVSSLAVDFVQYCDGSEAALRGGVRINSDHPF